MARLIQSPLARADLAAIWRYIADDNRAAADRLLRKIGSTCEMLAAHPLMGESRPELAPDVRAFVVGNYVIFYRPIEDGIELVRVVHGARDVDSLF